VLNNNTHPAPFARWVFFFWENSMTTDTKWRKLVNWLKREFPSNHPAQVCRRRRATKKKPLCGYCDFIRKEKKYYVYVDRSQVWALQCDTMIHEWAHVLTWHGNDEDDHGEEWALAYAKIYRAFLVWNYGRPLPEDEA